MYVNEVVEGYKTRGGWKAKLTCWGGREGQWGDGREKRPSIRILNIGLGQIHKFI
jgi:hypothetical protein